MKLLVVCGTNRLNSNTHKAATWVAEFLNEQGQTADFIDLHNFSLPWVGQEASSPEDRATTDRDQVKSWSERVQRAEAVIIVVPEYNHGYPGVLKNALDLLYAELNYKPILICGVSSGSLGGARMVEQLRLVLIDLRAVPIREAVYFCEAGELFFASPASSNEKLIRYEKQLTKALNELVFLAKPLAMARNERQSLP